MISREALLEQLDRLQFRHDGWGRSEVNELCNILMPDEEIEELVNGYYEAGFALLVATKDRVLLVDKKPLNYLTVEDIRFDMISEFDYSHRIIGAHVSISSGNKTLSFTSLNQRRLRLLLSYVQARMTDIKKTYHNQQETQQQHLEQMNEQLRQYLVSAQQDVQLARSELLQQRTASAGPVQTLAGGYVLPTPVVEQSMPVRDQDSFERAAAVSVGLVSQAQPHSSSVLRKIVFTPQQVALAAARRVTPSNTAYRQTPQTVER